MQTTYPAGYVAAAFNFLFHVACDNGEHDEVFALIKSDPLNWNDSHAPAAHSHDLELVNEYRRHYGHEVFPDDITPAELGYAMYLVQYYVPRGEDPWASGDSLQLC